MRVGGGNCRPQQSSGCGGSGEKAKVKSGGSGEKAAAKDAGVPYGQWKKQFHSDGFGDRSSSIDDRSGGGILGGIFGQGGLLSNLLGGWSGWGGKDYLNNYAGSTPQTVTSKNATPSLPVLDPANAPPRNVAARELTGINQNSPTGTDKVAYTNGAMNCGPTVLAMIGDAFGKKPEGMSDAEYINKLGAAAGTSEKGTTGNGLISALNDMGFETAANKGANLAWINDQLAMGHEVIANGDYYSLDAHPSDDKVAGHYVAVTAYQDGQYLVNDPATGGSVKLTPQQMADFIAHHPEGGFTLATWPDPTIVG